MRFLCGALLLAAGLQRGSAGSCASLNNCNGQGACNTVTSSCVCNNGFGSVTDISTYKAPDCSARTCPSDKAWVDIPTGPTTAHALAECSNQGLCDRSTGRCRCFAGYEGEACQRSACPGTTTPCSGHGQCVTLSQMAGMSNAMPFGPASSYGGYPDTTTWDQDKIYGCVCDSAWSVGFASGQTQAAQYYGPDCSLKHCPSGDDPRTTLVVESDCTYMSANGAAYHGPIGSDGVKYPYYPGVALPAGVTIATAATCTGAAIGTTCGAPGNLCFVECSNRGTCDRTTGVCSCFSGYWGVNCGAKMTSV